MKLTLIDKKTLIYLPEGNVNMPKTDGLNEQVQVLHPSQMSPFTLINTPKTTDSNKPKTVDPNKPKARLDVDVRYDEMLEESIIKLNDFRAPDNQIIGIYNEYGQKIPLTYNIRSDLTLYYETTSTF